MQTSTIYFDKQDYELLRIVTNMLDRNVCTDEQRLFTTVLHPHGIKEFAASPGLRIAQTVINLLHSLEEGLADDRLSALRSLYDEVISVVGSTFRYNTGRVLIQIMKELVRAHGNPIRQLMLAHNFRKAAGGNRRFVRKLLHDYHLLEMPEEWNQLTFDHHIHDSHTKGRKTASHLIMDAWIKGIRSLRIIYYNYIDERAVQELLQAAAIMDIKIQIGIEYRAVFREKYVVLIWEPPISDDLQTVSKFLREKEVSQLMEEGREASVYYSQNVFAILEQYNTSTRYNIAEYYEIELPEISEQELASFIASGQPSLLHLADLVYKHLFDTLKKLLPKIQAAYNATNNQEIREGYIQKVKRMRVISPELILHKWLIGNKKNKLPNPTIPASNLKDGPELLRLNSSDLLKRLLALRERSKVTLTLADTTPEDVLEILYDCKGSITHLEIFNLKDFNAGKMPYCAEVSELQNALNMGSAVTLKRLIADMIVRCRASGRPDHEERCEKLALILQNLHKLYLFYSKTYLGIKIGSDSTSRSNLMHGMGFAFTETLPYKTQKYVKSRLENYRSYIPIRADVESIQTYTPPQHNTNLHHKFPLMRHLPGLRYLGYTRQNDWKLRKNSACYDENGSCITTLGGVKNDTATIFSLTPEKKDNTAPTPAYLNTKLVNFCKIAIGFMLTMLTFSFTQQWWVLVWLGAPIWFGITGIRNIIQAVLAGRGLNRTSLLQWRDYVNWSRLSDSLLFTGISVPLLELVLRWGILGRIFGLTSATDPLLFYSIVSTTNGFYIASHNLLRGLQKEAIIGNLFRSVLAIPLALIYNLIFVKILTLLSLESALPILADASAVISKAASDTVAGLIEGFADQRTNMDMRNWDYTAKIRQFFSCYTKLEFITPDKDTLSVLLNPDSMFFSHSDEVNKLEQDILIHSLDLMYFFMYQPRGRSMMEQKLKQMSPEEKYIFVQTQHILTRQKAVSQLFVDGLIGDNFSPALAFYLNYHKKYLDLLGKMATIKS